MAKSENNLFTLKIKIKSKFSLLAPSLHQQPFLASLFLSSCTCRNMILNQSVHVFSLGYFLIYYPSGCSSFPASRGSFPGGRKEPLLAGNVHL